MSSVLGRRRASPDSPSPVRATVDPAGGGRDNSRSRFGMRGESGPDGVVDAADSAAELVELGAVDVHVGLVPVVVRLIAQAGDVLSVIRAGQALVVANHIADLDPK